MISDSYRDMHNAAVCRRGQSLIEAVVAIGVVIMLVTGLIVGTTVALKNSRLARNRSTANKYAQEGIELARGLRDRGWIGFQARDGLYCLGDDSIFPDTPSASCTINIGTAFTRSVSFNWQDPRMETVVTVSWYTGTQTVSSVLKTYFTQWK